MINGPQVSRLPWRACFAPIGRRKSALITGAFRPSANGLVGAIHPASTRCAPSRAVDTAAALRALLAGSVIPGKSPARRRAVRTVLASDCQPQVDGACLDLLRSVARTLKLGERRDRNPLVLGEAR